MERREPIFQQLESRCNLEQGKKTAGGINASMYINVSARPLVGETCLQCRHVGVRHVRSTYARIIGGPGPQACGVNSSIDGYDIGFGQVVGEDRL